MTNTVTPWTLLCVVFLALAIEATRNGDQTTLSPKLARIRGQVILIPSKGAYVLCWKGVCDPRLWAEMGKRTPFYNFGIGKRAYDGDSLQLDDDNDDDHWTVESERDHPMLNFLDDVSTERDVEEQHQQTLLDEDDDTNDLNSMDAKRSRYSFGIGKKGGSIPRYNFGLGKREGPHRYNFGLGKRDLSRYILEKREADSKMVQDVEDEPLSDDHSMNLDDNHDVNLDKRSATYNDDMGKRRYLYNFGLGKRARMYDFGLGKRLPILDYSVSKRNKMYSFGLGKRKLYSFGLGKRDVSNYGRTYSFGLGKRSNEEEDTEEGGDNPQMMQFTANDQSDLWHPLHMEKRGDRAPVTSDNVEGQRPHQGSVNQPEDDEMEKRNRFSFGLGKRNQNATTAAPNVGKYHYLTAPQG